MMWPPHVEESNEYVEYSTAGSYQGTVLHLRGSGSEQRLDAVNSSFLRSHKCVILVGKPEGKIPLGRPRRRWVDNIKMDLR
jgi:hypothetical protein